MKHPKLSTTIYQADATIRPGVIVEPPGPMLKMTHDEGRALIAFLGGEYKNTVKKYFFKVRLDGNLYSIYIEREFGEQRPNIL